MLTIAFPCLCREVWACGTPYGSQILKPSSTTGS